MNFMDKINYTIKIRKYQQFSLEERKIIKRMLGDNRTQTEIAKVLGKHRSSVSREIKRGLRTKTIVNPTNKKYEPYYKEVVYYDPNYAHEKYLSNKTAHGEFVKVFENEFMCKELDRLMLECGYSPDVAINEYKRLYPNEYCICVKTLYNWIDSGYMRAKNIDLLLKVRRKPKKQKKSGKDAKTLKGTSIEKRPEEVNSRIEFGHFEGDSIIPKNNKGQIITITERKTRFSFTFRFKKKFAKNIIIAIGRMKKIFKSKFNEVMKTITFDNGSEFVRWEEIEKKYKVKTYYAHAYSSFERGTNEHFNGMLRRKIKKNMTIKEITEFKLEKATAWVNNMPRRILNYKSAQELFEKEIKHLTKVTV